MKPLFKIAAFLMLLFVLTAEDCSDNSNKVSREDVLIEEYANIEEKFLGDEIGAEIRAAFEKRAVEKLKDVFDYLNIYADSSISIEFRKQAKLMIQKTFYTSSEINKLYQNLELQEDSTNQLLFKIGYKNQGNYTSIIDEIVISENLKNITSSEYKGELQFLQKEFLISSTDSIQKNTTKRFSEIVAIKTAKKFGDNTRTVWEVYLGEIK